MARIRNYAERRQVRELERERRAGTAPAGPAFTPAEELQVCDESNHGRAYLLAADAANDQPRVCYTNSTGACEMRCLAYLSGGVGEPHDHLPGLDRRPDEQTVALDRGALPNHLPSRMMRAVSTTTARLVAARMS